ncbi:MAG: hemin receptor [Prevotella sp.]|nr:hemin receptor [Candidatus Prevotella equi]
MKKNILLAAIALLSVSAMAQETYDNAEIASEDLNGTARYVGMGGAMEALGADITTMNTNPAGIGLFRRSVASVSAGVTATTGNDVRPIANYDKYKTTNVDFNQIGFIFSTGSSSGVRFNMGFNYHRSRNFNQIINAVGALDDASASKRSFMSLASCTAGKGFKPGYNYPYDRKGDPRVDIISLQDYATDMALNSSLSAEDGTYYDPVNDETWYYDSYTAANMYGASARNSGFINNFDFNFSGSSRNQRVFWGLTLGLRDVRYNNKSQYDEMLCDVNNVDNGDYNFLNDRRITGSGFNFKVGVIFRPIENSPFRVGLYINSPTWYSLTCRGVMKASSYVPSKSIDNYYGEEYAFRYYTVTPWKFGASLGTTIGSKVALGATYEFSDYSSISNRVDDGTVVQTAYDFYGPYSYSYERSSVDRVMNDNTKRTLRGVSLLKVGVEIKPAKNVAVRAGYNYRSAIYKNSGSKNLMIDPSYSTGNMFTTYDFVNWGATNRITFGLGFALSEKINLDLSYQYSTQKGEYHPFQNIDALDMYTNSDRGNNGLYNMNPDPDSPVYIPASLYASKFSVKNNRHQANVTLSYKF